MKFNISTLVNTTLATVLLASIFLVSAVPSSSVGEYDPWCDLDDDGDIDIFDIVKMAGKYGTTGTPINKTELLMELQSEMLSLNASVMELSARVNNLEFLLLKLLVGYWNLNEGDGVIAHDSSTYMNDGIIYGASWTTGKSGSALSFNGIDSYVEVQDDFTLDCTEITLEAWVKVNGTTDDHQIIATKWYPDYSYTMELNPEGTIPQFVLNIGEAIHVIVSNIAVPIGSWAHMAGTYDGSTMRIYVNGTLAGDKEVSGSIAVWNSLLCIGSHSPVAFSDRNWFKGVIDEVRIYNKALTSEEILADMNG